MLANKTRLLDTYMVLVLIYSSWRIPIVIWIMKGFFENVPKSFEESALIDGCTKIEGFLKIVLPLSMPVLAASSVLLFVYVWNEFIIAVTLTSSIKVVTVGLYSFLSSYGIEWGEVMSAAMYALLPVLVFFFFFQRSLIQGLTAGGLKG
jgi:ABC-type glycerol-3-phosphate transport system permease component